MGDSSSPLTSCTCDECHFILMTRAWGSVCSCGHKANSDGGCLTRDGKRVNWTAKLTEYPVSKPADLKPRKQKPQVQMLPYDPHAWEARVVEHGAKKYARGNFRLPIEGEAPHEKASEYIRAAMGHLWAQAEQIERYIAGLVDDPLAIDNDSGLPHLAHAMCSVSFAIQAGIDGGIFPKDPKASKKEKSS